MGKGDRKTKKGKIRLGSYGKVRPRKKSNNIISKIAVEKITTKLATPKKATESKVVKKTSAKKKVTAKKAKKVVNKK